MNTKMSFIPMLKEFLLTKGVIFTVRKYKMVEKLIEVEGVGNCQRSPLGPIAKRKDLLPYVELSGFPTAEDWWAKIRFFIPNLDSPVYLYKVERV